MRETFEISERAHVERLKSPTVGVGGARDSNVGQVVQGRELSPAKLRMAGVPPPELEAKRSRMAEASPAPRIPKSGEWERHLYGSKEKERSRLVPVGVDDGRRY